MYHIGKDKREQRSAEKLKGAAERIILDKDPQKLTVSLLCEEAGVSRPTFYRLFDTPMDIVQYGADSMFHDILQGYVDLIERADRHDLSVPSSIRWYAEGFRKNADLIAGVVHCGGAEALREAHKKALIEFAPVLFPDLQPGTDEFTYFMEMRAAVFLAGLTAWVETGQKDTLETIQHYARQQLKYFSEE